jgi:short-subunit dehydrogenase
MSFRERYGRWALIAGASEGTGAAFARQLAAAGLNCVLVARREAPLAALAEELRGEFGIECVTASIDLSASDAAQQLAEAAGTREIGLLVANAGADSNGSLFLETEIASWDALVMRNVMLVMRACHHFGGAMRKRGRGGIILVGSGACYGGAPGIAVYGASKAFDLLFGEALWAELRPHGVDVLNLIMGQTDTPAHRELMERLGLPFPAGVASADAVAALGLARLAHGPVQNWGQADDEAGMEDRSAAQRRDRVLMIEQFSRQYARPERAP